MANPTPRLGPQGGCGGRRVAIMGAAGRAVAAGGFMAISERRSGCSGGGVDYGCGDGVYDGWRSGPSP